MNGLAYIVDTPLPDSQDFTALKSKGLDCIQSLSGQAWSDFNESDPGITILDQLCYALTELGYCSAFPVADILTGPDGGWARADQFFAPEKILTTAPVTARDYRSLLLDRIPALAGVVFRAGTASNGVLPACGVDLALVPGTGAEVQTAAVAQVQALLNEYRNVGEIFAKPRVLTPVTLTLTGTVLIAAGSRSDAVLADIRTTLRDYVLPGFRQAGYSALRAAGFATDAIFNGPVLQNGWSTQSADYQSVTTDIELTQIVNRISALSAVEALQGLTLLDASGKPVPGVRIADGEIAEFSVTADGLHLIAAVSNGSGAAPDEHAVLLQEILEKHERSPLHAVVDLAPALPTGNFRNIKSYYSIQNTFPTAYAIGYDSLQFSSSSYRIAQSRQLKGYLMVFDQLLANEFAQLAEAAQLFSFEPGNGARTAVDPWLRGIPRRMQPPTYFCQPLYDVPDVKPLLRGSTAYDFGNENLVPALREQAEWDEYRHDPFNEYMAGLRNAMEDDDECDDRWNRALDHLLARHGWAALTLQKLVGNPQWQGSLDKTRILVKRLLLQNFQALSYHRAKGYNLLTATALTLPGRFRIAPGEAARLARAGFTPPVSRQIAAQTGKTYSDRHGPMLELYQALSGRCSKSELRDVLAQLKLLDAMTDAESWHDGKFDADALYRRKHVSAQALRDYAAVELAADLLLCITDYYSTVLTLLVRLLDNTAFLQWLGQASPSSTFAPADDANLGVLREQGKDSVQLNGQCVLTLTGTDGAAPDKPLYLGVVDQLLWLARQRKGLLLCEKILPLAFLPAGTAVPRQASAADALVLLPDYLPYLQQASFTQALATLANQFWPVHVTCKVVFVSSASLTALIPSYVAFHNAARFDSGQDAGKAAAAWLTALAPIGGAA
ncbi:MAG TPA: hypothetical protein VMH83_11305 [Candidatus Acidoferrum sp.]|nr:hypothetical protein [Candidatus Acidoferrum sp.]